MKKKKIRDERKKKLLYEILSNMKFQEDNNNSNNSNNNESDGDSLNEKEFQDALNIFGLENENIRVNNYCNNFLKNM